ncbi:hypothetical protein RugamoR64_35610 [Duganella rhizosphaerae]
MLFAPAGAAAQDLHLVKVMPIGDSLTAGYPLTPELSYRKELRRLLRQDGKEIDYVGAFDQDPAAPLLDLAHQGQVGATIGIITNAAAWKQFRPDIILLMAGTNDFRLVDASTSLGGLRRVASAIDLGALLEQINLDYQSMGMPVQIFVSTIPPMGFATVSGSSRVLDTLPMYLETNGGSFDTVSQHTGAITEAQFLAAFSAFLTRQKLNPDLDHIFHAADANGDNALAETEYTAALRLLTECILNKFIEDYNSNIRAVASNIANTHFLDAGSQLTLADFTDGTHPATQQGYDKLAPAWFSALHAYFAGLPRYWIGTSGFWNDGINWAATPNGPGGVGQPTGGSAYLLQDDNINRTVIRDNDANPALLLDLRIDATGSGQMTLRSTADLRAVLLAVGLKGKGRIEQTDDSTTTVPTLIMGSDAGSAGEYVLDGPSTTLRTVNEELGFNGSGSFFQDNGNNDVLRQLILGFTPTGSGSYTLTQGTLSANEEFIGLGGGGMFIQIGGTHRVEAKSPTAGGVEGTMTIASDSGSHGSYALKGGSLSAINVVNNGTFDYSGGTLAATRFINNGTLRLAGRRQLDGDLFLPLNGQIQIPDAFRSGAPTHLDLSGGAELEGRIIVSLAPGATPQLGDSAVLMTAAHGISPLLPGALRVPLLPGKLILHGEIVGRSLLLVVAQVTCDDVSMVRSTLGRRGNRLAGDVNNDGVVDVRDLAIMAQKLPSGTSCSF